MDIFYAVKQLAHEIDILQAQLSEKKAAVRKLWGALSHQEQLLVDAAHPVLCGAVALRETPVTKKS